MDNETKNLLGTVGQCGHPASWTTTNITEPVMTLREYFAGLAMQGLLSDGFGDCFDEIEVWACKHADALIEELAKTEKKKEAK